MLTLWRRHSLKCGHSEDRYYRKCRCPLWATGTVEGKFVRRALKTRSWERAEELKREIEGGRRTESTTLSKALDAFYADCLRRGLAEATLRKYRTLIIRLKKKDGPLASVSVEQVRAFVSSLKLQPRSQMKAIERLRSFWKTARELTSSWRSWATKSRNPLS